MERKLSGRRILVTGGAGFIGSHLVEALLADGAGQVDVLDAFTYAANPLSLEAARRDPRCRVHRADVAETGAVAAVVAAADPDLVFHLAAETHVDRSIEGPRAFVRTNVTGTAVLLEALLAHWERLPATRQGGFLLVHVSTDEVFGSLEEGAFTETSPYHPNSPYAASKAGGDHLVRAWVRTFGLPAVVTHCGNNYGPRQFPEKLVPLVILKAMAGEALPVYGRGENVRDWIHVRDHCRALLAVARRGQAGASYCIGAGCRLPNLELVRRICDRVDALGLGAGPGPSRDRITFVPDRPGHDLRYAVDPSRLQEETGWRPEMGLETGLDETIRWFAGHRAWVETCRRHGWDGRRRGLRRPAEAGGGER